MQRYWSTDIILRYWRKARTLVRNARARMKLIRAYTRVVSYWYIYDVLSSRRRETGYGYPVHPRTPETHVDYIIMRRRRRKRMSRRGRCDNNPAKRWVADPALSHVTLGRNRNLLRISKRAARTWHTWNSGGFLLQRGCNNDSRAWSNEFALWPAWKSLFRGLVYISKWLFKSFLFFYYGGKRA